MENFFPLLKRSKAPAVRRPELVVGVDFGMTCTAVAWIYCDDRHPGSEPPQVIQDWPGRGTSPSHDMKVPTKIMYRDDNRILSEDTDRVLNWGYGLDLDCHRPGADAEASTMPFSLFKLFVDPDELARCQSSNHTHKVPATHEHALKIVTDYLHCVYQHVEKIIMQAISCSTAAAWDDLAIDFVFSVPTTWAPKTVNYMKTCILNAGFAKNSEAGPTEGPHHIAVVDLTEAEAAAVMALKDPLIRLSEKDIMLCIDAGGGTTDLALVRVKAVSAGSEEIDQVGTVRGFPVGSILINRDFQQLVQKRIDASGEGVANANGITPATAVKMAAGWPFESLKRGFGDDLCWAGPKYSVRVSELADSSNVPSLQVEKAEMYFTRDEIQSLFDGHICTIINKVKDFLTSIKNQGWDYQVTKVVLSGGLGASPYVKSRLEKELGDNPHERAEGALFIRLREPQLAVAKGLVSNWQRALNQGKPMLATRNARTSYGIVVQLPFDPDKHAPEDKEPDPINRKKNVAKNQIEWLVKKGQTIDPKNPPSYKFEMHMGDGDPPMWAFEIVQDDGDVENLPTSMRLQKTTTKLCDLDSNVSNLDRSKLSTMKTGARYYYLSRKKYKVCKFEIVVIVAPADLRFEVQIKGELHSEPHQPLWV